jgi:acyl-CoA reductase-like NAD-dependent aldehyde dehydrogenase
MTNRKEHSVTVHNPYDGTKIETIAAQGSSDVENALATAAALYAHREAWLPLPKRIEILENAVAIMREDLEDLAMGIAREGGKPLADARVEARRAAVSLLTCVECLRTEPGTVHPMNVDAGSANRLAFTQNVPIGPVVAVSAFNHPLNLIVHQVGPAVAAGCPVIVKPADDTPLSCLRFVEILREAGLPDEWCQPLILPNRDDAEALVTDERVAFFSFIGSAKVGWYLRSKLSPGTRCALEHGGAAPVILAEDADQALALASILKGGFYHAGQVCVSVQRIFVPESMARDFAAELAKRAEKLVIGAATDAKTEVGPLIRPGEITRVDEWVQEAKSAGGEILCGGTTVSGHCYAPTVIYDPPADIRVSQREIFGPVLCVYPVRDLNEAIARSNDVPFSFQAALFTKDIDTALKAFKHVNASAVMVNDHTAFRVDWMPFAGLNVSGLGVGGIPHTLRDMQVEKMLVIKSDEI